MTAFVKFGVKIWLMLLKVIGLSSVLFDNGNITFAYCEHGFYTTNTRMNSNAFNIAIEASADSRE